MIRESSISLIIIFAGFFANYLANALLGRLLDAEEFGNFMVVVSAVQLGATLFLLGADSAILKFFPEYLSQNDLQHAHGYIRRLINLFAFAAVVLIVFNLIFVSVKDALIEYHVLSGDHILFSNFWLIIILSAVILLSKLLRSLRSIVLSSMSTYFLVQIILFLSVYGVYKFLGAITVKHAVWLYFASLAISMIIQISALRSLLPTYVFKTQPAYRNNEWLEVSLQLMVSGFIAVSIESVGLLALKIFCSNEKEVGILGAILTIAGSFWVVYRAVSTVFSPLISPCIQRNDQAQSQHLLNSCMSIMLVCTSLLLIIIIIFGKQFLNHFGANFVSGYSSLILVSASLVFVVSVSGVNRMFLQFSNNQGPLLYAMMVIIVFSVIINCIAARTWGLPGSALAIVITNTSLGIASMALVKLKMKLKPFFII